MLHASYHVLEARIYIYIYMCVCVCVCAYVYMYIYKCNKTNKNIPALLFIFYVVFK